MIAVIQRVKNASVIADGDPCGQIENGLLVLLGVAVGDGEEECRLLCDKVLNLRIFSDEAGKMNLSLLDTKGELLVVSNFTLCANYSHGHRPDYFGAEKPALAIPLYEKFISLAKEKIDRVATGKFGADMQLTVGADGPVTIVMDTNVLKKGRAK